MVRVESDAFQPHTGETALDVEPDRRRAPDGQVDLPRERTVGAFREWAAVVDAHRDAAPEVEVGDAHACVERERAMGGGEGVLIEGLAVRGQAPVVARPVEGSGHVVGDDVARGRCRGWRRCRGDGRGGAPGEEQGEADEDESNPAHSTPHTG